MKAVSKGKGPGRAGRRGEAGMSVTLQKAIELLLEELSQGFPYEAPSTKTTDYAEGYNDAVADCIAKIQQHCGA